MPVVLLQRPSPNYNSRDGSDIDCIVLHADAAPKIAQSIDWLRDPESKVSYHVIIGRLGDCYQLVDFDDRAWHAGKSVFQGVSDVNDYSIGVCFGNRQDGVERFTEAQYQVGAELCRELCDRYLITTDRITTHQAIAPTRKSDPGRFFDLPYFLELVSK